ncbi:MAG: peptidoglycan-associated lipoprotein Pal [Nitrospinae bacterium]|nr:peptidoglycan-associated lipoprotein Pal [Nitrospinota bacterium]
MKSMSKRISLASIAMLAFAVALSVGACSTKSKETLPGAGDKAGTAGQDGAMSAEERKQQESRATYVEESLLVDIHFEFDKSDLSAEDRELLKKNGEWMKSHAGVKVQIEGHCDERGTAEYNLALGERRATAAKNYLTSLGVEADRLYTISYGKELPIDPGHSEEAWAKNRRAHFLVTK